MTSDMLEILEGISPDVPAFKVRKWQSLQVTLNFELE